MGSQGSTEFCELLPIEFQLQLLCIIMDQTEEDLQDLELRSLTSRHRVKILFRNNSGGPVRLLWLNYQGEEVDYGLIGRSDTMFMNTFLTHPWVCISVDEDEEGNINKEDADEDDKKPLFQWPDEGKLRPVFEAQKYAQKMFEASTNDDNKRTALHQFVEGRLRLDVIIRTKHNPLT